METGDKTIHRPDWRRFTETDWYGFAGAEPFGIGDEPWVAEIALDGQPAVAIVDASGISVVVTPVGDAERTEDECWTAHDGNAILGLAARSSRVELERLGFRSTTSEVERTRAHAMVRVQFQRFSEPDPIPTWIDGSVRAVPAAPFEGVDSGQGGITRADIPDDAMVLPLDTFPTGAEVYVESDDPTECLFDEDPEAERTSHIWWRATVLRPEGSK